MKLRVLLATALLAMCSPVQAQTGFSITGGLSNFDCGNHCDEPCDEFEIEIEGIHPEDVVHTYHNGNYGNPTVTPGPGGLTTIIDYRNPQHPTAVNAIEHFGISLRQLSSANTIRVRWMVGGHSATVNGQVPLPGGGSAPATQPMLPSINAEMATGTSGGDGVACSVTNNDLFQSIWIKRRAQVSMGTVSLEALMPNNPVVTTTTLIDPAPILIGPGQTLTLVSDLVEIEDNESVVFAAEYFQDLAQAGPFNNSHVIGPALGNVMTASIASPDAGCNVSSPVIIDPPQSTTVLAGHDVDLRVDADGNDLPLTYQWMKEGVVISNGGPYSGATGDELTINSLSAATEGFYSVRVSNACGSITSASALVFIQGHNVPPPRPTTGSCCDALGNCTVIDQAGCVVSSTWTSNAVCDPNPCTQPTTGACCGGAACSITDELACPGTFLGVGSACAPRLCCPADFDGSEVLNVADIFAFLSGWFSSNMDADFDQSGSLGVADIFTYLSQWFAGCP